MSPIPNAALTKVLVNVWWKSELRRNRDKASIDYFRKLCTKLAIAFRPIPL
jgi:hypothetical protein